MYLQDVRTGERFPLERMKGRTIASICGIAKPESFEGFLRTYGASLVHHQRFADHHRFTRKEVGRFLADAVSKKAELVLTTEKDAVRLPPLDDAPIPVLFMRVEIDIIGGHESFAQCIDRICFSTTPPMEEIEPQEDTVATWQ